MIRRVCVIALLLFVVHASWGQVYINEKASNALIKLQQATLQILSNYVDTIDSQKLTENGIRGMLDKLDPHSSYLTAKEVQQANEPLQGNFEGIGVQFNMVEDTLLVVQPVTGGPSEKKGILAGDRIVKVNDTIIAGVKMSTDEIKRRLRGPKGTKVYMGIVRRGITDTLSFTVVRDKIPVKTIDAAYMIQPQVGYIRIGSFGATTHDEFCERLKVLKKQGMKSLILDLQENGGGYLQAAVDIADEFLQKDELIVYTEGRKPQRTNYKARGGSLFTQGKLIVLVDSYTASAAEIVSGAIQDQDRGLVVGRRTFGKGLVQRPIMLPDGSMIRLTIAHYYTPSGRCIQKPYENGRSSDYAKDVYNRLKSGELMSADSVHFADSLKCYTLKNHRVVYGGGGIMPDEFVPLDTTKYTRFHRQLSAKSIIINANLHYIDQHRKELQQQYREFADFRKNFVIPQQLIDNILAEGKKQNIEPKDEEERMKTLPYLRLQLKALMSRDLWGLDEYFTIMNEQNDVLLRALQLL